MFAFLCVLFNALHADKSRERCFHIIIPFVIGIVGFIVGAVTQNLGARFFALFVQAQSYAGYGESNADPGIRWGPAIPSAQIFFTFFLSPTPLYLVSHHLELDPILRPKTYLQTCCRFSL